MSRTRKGSKGPGFDYWSRRPPNTGMQGFGPFAKHVTHRKERRIATREVRRALRDAENADTGAERERSLGSL